MWISKSVSSLTEYLSEIINPVTDDPGRHHLRSAVRVDIDGR